MGYCTTHSRFYTFGRCPNCLEAEVRAKTYGQMASVNARWGQLQAQPATIDQDKFGVCGTTTCVYLLLKHNPLRATELFEATFADVEPNYGGRTFQTAVGHAQIPIKFRYLTRRFRLMQQKLKVEARTAADDIRNQALHLGYDQADADNYADRTKQDIAVNKTCFVDYCLSRALGYVLKKTAKNRYDGEKMEFNLEFDPLSLGNYRNFTHLGNLALRTNNLAFILSNILGAQHVHVASKNGPVPAGTLAPPVAGVGSSTFSAVDTLKAAFDAHLVNPGSFAIAAVYGALVNNAHNGHLGESFSGGKPSLSYNHWVLIESFNTSPKDTYPGCPFPHVDLRIWTWGKTYDIHVCRNRFLSYIQDVIFGDF